MLDQATEIPEGFTPSINDTVWEMEISHAKNLPNPKPKQASQILLFFALIGYYDGTSCFYLNLEMMKSLQIKGEQSNVNSYLTELVKEMITSEAKFKVFCVGFGHELLKNHKIMIVDRLSDILPVIEKQAEKFEYSTTSKEVMNKGYLPALIVDPFTDNQELTARLNLVVGKGITSIMAYGRAEVTLEVTETEISLSPLGLELKRELFEVDFSNNHKNQISQINKISQTITKEQPIKVRLMGSVGIDNTAKAFSSIQSLSLVCYLATHRDGVSSDQLMRWIWPPEAPPSRQSLANVVSRARNSLGSNPKGKSYITYAHGIYRLDTAIGSDYEEFMTLLYKAKQEQLESSKMMLLQEALLLVKGVPFSVGESKAFLWSDNILRNEIESKIDMAAHELCDIALTQDNFEVASFALQKAILCIPGCDQCLARTLIVAARSKNCGALINAKVRAVKAYESLGYEIPKSLLELFEKLYEEIKDGDPDLISIA